MARIRTIKPEFWESESVGLLSFGARLLFLSSLNLADDEGLLRWNHSYLSSSAFIYDDISESELDKWMKELETGGFIFAYVAGQTKQKLAWIINFKNHQVINRPQKSKIPCPSLQSARFREMVYSRDKYTCHLCGGEIDIHDPLNNCDSKAPSLDHLIPRSKGGLDYPSNLKTAHISCNKARNNSDLCYSLNDSLNDSLNNTDIVLLGNSLNESLTEGNGREWKRKGMEGNGKPLSDKPDNFSIFWNAYPKKIGKGEAEKCFRKAKPDIDQILTALAWQTKSKSWADGYIPNPSTYINQRRWEDEPAKPTARVVVSERGADMLQGAQNIINRRVNNGTDNCQTTSLVQISNSI